jgi:hypothetical protein
MSQRCYSAVVAAFSGGPNSSPQAESTRLVEFEGAEVVGGFINDTYYLIVNGVKPYLNMTVKLIPLVYVERPDYWGIEVVGTLPGFGLPAQALYTISIPLDGIRGKKGVEVIGATRRVVLDVPPF